MIDQILIINAAGVPLYNWELKEKTAESSMLSGFLTAMDTFAKGERGEQIRKITLDPTTFVFERESELVFVILTTEPEHEHLISHILVDVKDRFLDKFKEEAKTFTGNLNTFKPFNSIVEQILTNYGYFDYIRAKEPLETDDDFKCMVFIDRNEGDILFIKAKEYLDRDKLSFLTNILLNSLDRVFTHISDEKPTITILLSHQSRCLLFKSTEKLVIIQEKIHSTELGIADLKINEKQIKNTLKKPGKLIYESKDKFIFFDQMGKDIISNDRAGEFGGDNLPPDCITLINTSKNILKQIYQEDLFAVMIISENQLYCAFSILDYYVFMKLLIENITGYKLIFKKLKNCEVATADNTVFFKQIIQRIQNFESFFT